MHHHVYNLHKSKKRSKYYEEYEVKRHSCLGTWNIYNMKNKQHNNVYKKNRSQKPVKTL